MSFRAEYIARINRAIDYIETHLDQDLTLDQLARVAAFSSFHFHRIFSSFMGESLHRFILRLRLERAATQLDTDPNKSITAVALDCGFSSSATFARAFKAAFEMSASEWRGKKGKTDRNLGKASDASSEYGASRTQVRRHPMPTQTKEAQSTRIENAQSATVAYVRHIGPYAGDGDLFGRLFGTLMKWAGLRELLGPPSRMLTIYHDNPELTDEEKLRISVCVTVPANTRGEGEVGVMELAGGKYAVATFELDTTEYGAAWNWVMGTWLPESGYQPDDRPCFEQYLGEPDASGKHRVEIWIPVRPL